MPEFRFEPFRLLPLALSAALLLAPMRGGAETSPGATGRIRYSLQGLKPRGISQYTVPSRGAQREYLRFENAQGSHYLIYEEATGAAPSAAIQQLRGVVGHGDVECSMDLDCKMAAFCTGNCKNLYYETSNTPAALELLDRNHCEIPAYHCEKPLAAGRAP